MFRPIHRLVLILAFGLVLLAPWAATAQPRNAGLPALTTPDLSGPADLLVHAWAFLSQLWQKGGCLIDPSGSEGGCGIDPNGRDGGCLIDPDGSCSTTQAIPPVQGEEGCGIDPNGLCMK